MATRERGPELAQAPDPNAAPATAPTSSTTSLVRPARRLPGEQPDMPDAMHGGPSREQLSEQWMRERGRRELVISSLRQHLAEQPTARAVRLCARRWIADVNFIADGVIAVLNRTETEE